MTDAPVAVATTETPPARKGFGCALIVMVLVSAFCALMVMLIAPAAQRLAAPIVCAADDGSVVTTATSTNMDGENQMTSKFYCVDGIRAVPRSTFVVWLAMTGELLVVWLVLVVIGRVRTGLRRSQEVR